MEKNKINQVNLNFNYDSKGISSGKTNDKKKEGKVIDINKFDKKKKEKIIHSIKEQKQKSKKNEEKEKNIINIINSNMGPEKPKEKKIPFFINSINEIRLPPELYDISYDILQNE